MEATVYDEKDLQEPSREDGRHEDFLPKRHAQLPDARHRKYEDDKVGNSVEDSTGLKNGIEVKAMAPLHKRIPDLLAGSTQSDLKTEHDDIKYQVTPDAEMASDINEHVALSGRREDAKVLEQD